MFRADKDNHKQLSFGDSRLLMVGKASKQFTDDTQWHNVFRNYFYEKIDENVFSVLYDKNMGCPNSSVRLLVSMMQLKEGRGWTDEQLYQECYFNIQVRASVGLFDIQKTVPSASTYYLLKDKLTKYENETGINLIEKATSKLNGEYVIEFDVCGKKVRMDSKLLWSNISNQSRYTLIVNVLRKFAKHLLDSNEDKLTTEQLEFFTAILKEDAEKTVYTKTSEYINERLIKIGHQLEALITSGKFTKVKKYYLVKRIYNEHYKITDSQIELKQGKELSSMSLQSADDEDAAYRNKNDQSYKGYSANVTETCGNEGLNLITCPEIQPANAADCDFLQNGIEQTQQVTKQEVEEVYTDGAYTNDANDLYCGQNNIEHIATGMAGKTSDYEYSKENGNIIVRKITTNQTVIATTTSGGNFKVEFAAKEEKGKPLYFKQKQIDSYNKRQKLANIPQAKLNIRNNVEATIKHITLHLRKDKLVYRGITKARTWLNLRCSWINIVRIKNYLGKLCPKSKK